MAELSTPKWQLPYHAEKWLYDQNPKAWAYQKVLINEDDAEKQRQIISLAGEDVMNAIQDAYKK